MSMTREELLRDIFVRALDHSFAAIESADEDGGVTESDLTGTDTIIAEAERTALDSVLLSANSDDEGIYLGYWELGGFDASDWQPHKIQRGPRTGMMVYKNRHTGRLIDRLPSNSSTGSRPTPSRTRESVSVVANMVRGLLDASTRISAKSVGEAIESVLSLGASGIARLRSAIPTSPLSSLGRAIATKAMSGSATEKPAREIATPPEQPQKKKLARFTFDPSLSQNGKTAVKRVAAGISGNSKLTTAQKHDYVSSIQSVVMRMSDNAIDRFVNNVDYAVFSSSTDQLKHDLMAFTQGPYLEVLKRASTVGGCYRPSSRSLHLDGGRTGEAAVFAQRIGKAVTATGIYAHEFAHAIDGPEKLLSRSKSWMRAFREELANKQLNNYSATTPFEGFAEFGRLLLSGEFNTEAVKRKFPRCYSFWEKAGLFNARQAAGEGQSKTMPDIFSGQVALAGGGHADILKGAQQE